MLFLAYFLLGMPKTLTCRKQRHEASSRISIENEPEKFWEERRTAVESVRGSGNYHFVPPSEPSSPSLVNTLMLQEAPAEEKWKGLMKQEDWRELAPLFFQYINPYGYEEFLS